MSEQPEVVAPEADPAVLDEVLGAPGDVEAVDTESAELRRRFNGLMARHQQALDALVTEREARLQAEAQLQEGNQTMSEPDTETLTEVQALRQELKQSRLEAARAEALREFPDAEAFADLITGDSASEIREYTRALAERARTIKGSVVSEPEPEVETTSTAQTFSAPIPGSVGTPVPMVAGGDATPGVPMTPADALVEARRIAHSRPDSQEAWDAFFVSTVTPDAAAGLA